MSGSLIYSPSGSEGGRSLKGSSVADFERSPAGADFITTPRTTPRRGSRRTYITGGIEDAASVEGQSAVAKVQTRVWVSEYLVWDNF